MTKKGNTILFIVVGTLVNVILTLTIAACLMLFSLMLFKNNESAFMIAFGVSLMGSMFLSMFLYQKLAMWVIEKFNLSSKLDPLFVRKKKQ